MNSRDGFTSDQLAAMWPLSPNLSCAGCPPWAPTRGTVTWHGSEPLCDSCLEFERERGR